MFEKYAGDGVISRRGAEAAQRIREAYEDTMRGPPAISEVRVDTSLDPSAIAERQIDAISAYIFAVRCVPQDARRLVLWVVLGTETDPFDDRHGDDAAAGNGRSIGSFRDASGKRPFGGRAHEVGKAVLADALETAADKMRI
jgi:hypothetical protein